MLIGLLILAGGCSPTPPPPAPNGGGTAVRNVFESAGGERVEEIWESHRIRGAKVGYRHTRVERVPNTQPELLRIETTDQLELRRFGDVARQELTLISLETTDGQVHQLAYRVRNGETQSSVTGIVRDGRMELTRDQDTDRGPALFNWSPEQGGIFAIERSLRLRPMRSGDRRTVQSFLPLLDRLAAFELQARDLEPITVGDQTEQLLRIEATNVLGDDWKIPTLYWVRPDGTIVKTQEAFLDRETLRVTQTEALRANDLMQLDLGVDVGVRLEKPIADPQEVDYAVYRVQVAGISPLNVFANGLSQRVLAGGDDTALVTVSRISPDVPTQPDLEIPQPTEFDTAPNELIQSDHPRVVALAKAVAGSVDDPWRAATLLEHYLFRTLSKVDYSQVFSSAGEVAERKQGDCSEHAVLLAATCRARGIPARVAIGLLYSAEDQAFQYHMWNEVWIKDRWIPLDATLGQGGIGACHLKLRDSSLARQTPYSMVSPVMYLIGKLKIEPISIAHELPTSSP